MGIPRMLVPVAAAWLWCSLPAAAQMMAPPEDPAELAFDDCLGCHNYAPDAGPGRNGPNLWGVMGRVAGTAPGYVYSDALRDSGIVWTETNIDRWLTGPQSVVAGTPMTYYYDDRTYRSLVLEVIRRSFTRPGA